MLYLYVLLIALGVNVCTLVAVLYVSKRAMRQLLAPKKLTVLPPTKAGSDSWKIGDPIRLTEGE